MLQESVSMDTRSAMLVHGRGECDRPKVKSDKLTTATWEHPKWRSSSWYIREFTFEVRFYVLLFMQIDLSFVYGIIKSVKYLKKTTYNCTIVLCLINIKSFAKLEVIEYRFNVFIFHLI